MRVVRQRVGEEGRKGRLIVPALALAEHIDEVTLPTRPSYAKWTLQTGRPLNLICTSAQLPVKPRPDAGVDSLFTTSTPVCLFTDRFPSRISFLSSKLLTTHLLRSKTTTEFRNFPVIFYSTRGGENTISFFFFFFHSYQNFDGRLNFDGNCLCTTHESQWILREVEV